MISAALARNCLQRACPSAAEAAGRSRIDATHRCSFRELLSFAIGVIGDPATEMMRSLRCRSCVASSSSIFGMGSTTPSRIDSLWTTSTYRPSDRRTRCHRHLWICATRGCGFWRAWASSASWAHSRSVSLSSCWDSTNPFGMIRQATACSTSVTAGCVATDFAVGRCDCGRYPAARSCRWRFGRTEVHRWHRTYRTASAPCPGFRPHERRRFRC
mmetsp:Transcript_26649/g.74566  ORF Transcript_26649/g.74566 Transcript_26649/m.74566 type:complete len:215 (-) Transcript_26649:130-774(-)